MAAAETTKYVVRVLCNGKMLLDSTSDGHGYATVDEAEKRAKACASMGEYAEVRRVVTTIRETLLRRFESEAA